MKPINLDQTRQPELYAEACRAMTTCIPDWTDAYPGDPAVAILEYFSYLSNIQNHHLDRILPAHLQAYVRLLDGSPRAAEPSRLLALREKNCRVGQRFAMDAVPFEITDCAEGDLPQVRQVEFYGENGGGILRTGSGMKLPGGAGGTFRISLTGDLPAGRNVRFWFQIRQTPGRNLPAADTAAPVRFTAQIGGQPAACTDGTCGLLQSGMIGLIPQASGGEVVLQAHGIWEGRPELRNVVLEPLMLCQQQTRSTHTELKPPFRLPQDWEGNRVLFFFTPEQSGWKRETAFTAEHGMVTGWTGTAPRRIRVVAAEPDFAGTFPLSGIAMEQIRVEEPGLIPGQLEIMVEQNGLWYDCSLTEPEHGKPQLLGCRWDSRRSSLCFGDGRDYLVPDPGSVLLSRCVVTRGAELNGAFGMLTGPEGSLRPLTEAGGGVTEETAEEAFSRTAREEAEPCRAVTCEDYEILARRTPGLAMSRIRAVPRRMLGEEGPGMVILAKPQSDEARPALSEWQKQQMLGYLEPMRLVGIPMEIRPARYCPLRVRVSVQSSEAVSAETLRQAALPLTDSVEGPLDFGAEISYTALYAALGRVPHVRMIRYLEVIPLSGGIRRGSDGSLRLAPDQLPVLAEFEVMD